MVKKIFLILLLLFVSISPVNFFTHSVFAQEEKATGAEFSTSYDVIYDVGDDGVTTVTEKIILKNLTSEYYASQFNLIIGATQITDIKASDASGPMVVTSVQKDNSTTINVKFNQQVAGVGKSLPWTLQFKSKDFAEKTGKVWEVRAPKVSSSTNLENYNLTISVPTSFGDPTLISPTPRSQTVSGGKLFLTFTKDQLINSGVSANFGSMQLFDFDLSYHLSNNNLIPIVTNIALPPDTAYQDVVFQRIEPKPINVSIDDDGNYLAWYKLTRGQRLDIKVTGSAKLYSSSKVKNPTLSEDLRKEYTKSDKYWEKDHPVIVAKVVEILTNHPSADNAEKVKLIYRYVVNNLKYDFTRLNNQDIERLGAVTVLNNPTSAVCMEFTDLFIALTRSIGVPAREVNGYAYSSNQILRPRSLSKDILHSWPQYWDEKQGWVMVDPTWENTTGGVDYFSKLDLNHFAFAIRGLSSKTPTPAGSYKYLNQDTHDVKITLSDNDFLGKPQLDVAIDIKNPILAGFPGKIKVKITNLGNAVFPTTDFSVVSSKLNILNGSTQNLGSIPSFGTASFDINFRTKSLFESFNDQILIVLGSQIFTKDVKVVPIIMLNFMPGVLIGIILFMILIYLGVLIQHVYKTKKSKKKE